MARIVMKFGGTSVGDCDRIKNVARRVKAEVERGNEVAVVVSAMSGVTNQLVDYCKQIAPLHDAREYDAVVATGEQVTTGLLAIALQELGMDARSWCGWQLPIRTDDAHGKARIVTIETEEMLAQDGQGPDRRGGRFPGLRSRQPHRHPGPRRLGHQRRGFGRRPACRSLRYLYGRGRCLYHRSPDRCQGPQAR